MAQDKHPVWSLASPCVFFSFIAVDLSCIPPLCKSARSQRRKRRKENAIARQVVQRKLFLHCPPHRLQFDQRNHKLFVSPSEMRHHISSSPSQSRNALKQRMVFWEILFTPTRGSPEIFGSSWIRWKQILPNICKQQRSIRSFSADSIEESKAIQDRVLPSDHLPTFSKAQVKAIIDRNSGWVRKECETKVEIRLADLRQNYESTIKDQSTKLARLECEFATATAASGQCKDPPAQETKELSPLQKDVGDTMLPARLLKSKVLRSAMIWTDDEHEWWILITRLVVRSAICWTATL